MPTMAPATEKRKAQIQQFLDVFNREHQTTVRVLRAYPQDKLDLKPHKMCKNARDLAWMFVMEQGLAEKGITNGLDWSAPRPGTPPAPESLDAIINAFDDGHRRVVDIVNRMSDDEFDQTIKFPVAPKTIGDVSKMNFLWMLLHDQIHHRGQFSIYLRMADGKVPSIYGPTADEPWM